MRYCVSTSAMGREYQRRYFVSLVRAMKHAGAMIDESLLATIVSVSDESETLVRLSNKTRSGRGALNDVFDRIEASLRASYLLNRAARKEQRARRLLARRKLKYLNDE